MKSIKSEPALPGYGATHQQKNIQYRLAPLCRDAALESPELPSVKVSGKRRIQLDKAHPDMPDPGTVPTI